MNYLSMENPDCYICRSSPLNPEWDVDAGFIDCVHCLDSGVEPIPFTEFING
jgi:hypothetical protein